MMLSSMASRANYALTQSSVSMGIIATANKITKSMKVNAITVYVMT